MSEFFSRLPEFIGNHVWLVVAFIVLLIVFIATEVLKLFSKNKALTPATLTQLINRQDAMVLDLSSHNDFAKGHIPGAKHMAAKQFDPQDKQLVNAKERPIVVVCKDGRASAKAAQSLVKAGFDKVYTLTGGVSAWRQAQLPVATGNK